MHPRPLDPLRAMTAIEVLTGSLDLVGIKKQKKKKEARLVSDGRMIAPHSGTPGRTRDERPPVAPPTAGTREAPCGRDSG